MVILAGTGRSAIEYCGVAKPAQITGYKVFSPANACGSLDGKDGENHMWHVIQTFCGQEEKTADMIRKQIPPCYMEECFIPQKERLRKFCGSWHKVEEIMFPGYVFTSTRQPDRLYQELKKIPKLTKVLGREGEYFAPLNRKEEEMVRSIGDQNHKTSLSKIKILAGKQNLGKHNQGKQIRIIEGPLKNYVGNIVKVNLHKREVVIEVEFMGGLKELHLGIEMVEDSFCSFEDL